MTRRNQRKISRQAQAAKRRLFWRRLGRISMALALSTIAVVGCMWMNKAMRITQWHIKAPANIYAAIDQELNQRREQLDFWHARPAALARDLKQNIPEISDIKIIRHLPDTLEITARARKPVALWQHLGAILLVDSKGLAYAGSQDGATTDLPQLRVDEKHLPAAVQLIRELAALQPSRLANLSEVRTDGEGWRLYFSRGEMWLLPAQESLPRLQRITQLLRQPRWSRGHWRIDARASRRWFIRTTNQEGVI